MKITLAILAAGLGSRYGADKQLEHIHNDNILLDYSIYSALKAGFEDVVLIIRSEIDSLVKGHFENKFEGVKFSYVYQDVLTPKNLERKKPWGTGHALLCLKDTIKNPFLIINADDYYGVNSFIDMAKALRAGKEKMLYSAGYKLRNTLSENGTVSRGICKVDDNHFLQSIEEARKLRKLNENTVIDEETNQTFDIDTYVSMNFWGFLPEIFPIAQAHFDDFIKENKDDPNAEFYIPSVAKYAHDEGYKVEVLPNNENWFGLTYREDLAFAKKEIEECISAGIYPTKI